MEVIGFTVQLFFQMWNIYNQWWWSLVFTVQIFIRCDSYMNRYGGHWFSQFKYLLDVTHIWIGMVVIGFTVQLFIRCETYITSYGGHWFSQFKYSLDVTHRLFGLSYLSCGIQSISFPNRFIFENIKYGALSNFQVSLQSFSVELYLERFLSCRCSILMVCRHDQSWMTSKTLM